MAIEKRTLGKTGVEVTMLGLGGEGILRTTGYEDQAYTLIHRAIDLGINYCESARAYADSESYYGRALRERRGDIFLTSKSHARDSNRAIAHLRETLKNMKTDHLDLWQVHDVRTDEDVAEIFGEGGAIEAFVEAKKKGMTRFIGVTGHHDPAVMLKCLELFDFDTVLLPINAGEPSYRSFLQGVVPLALEKRMGIIGMKVYFRGLAERLPWYTSMEPFLRFALTQPVTAVVIGCDNIDQLEENVKLTESFTPMTDHEMQALVHKVSAYARRLMYYKP
jgi:aryl-alcohol dehydrogenase-like predicted oxidoreductase